MLSCEQLQALRNEPLRKGSVNRIGRALELANRTQVDVAAVTGLTQSYISRIQNGRYEKLPTETARVIADYFGCAIEDIFPAREAIAS